jgi:hypothetical protein
VATLRSQVGGDARRPRENTARDAEALRKNLPYQTTEEIDKAIAYVPQCVVVVMPALTCVLYVCVCCVCCVCASGTWRSALRRARCAW